MAEFKIFAKKLLKWEGPFVDDRKSRSKNFREPNPIVPTWRKENYDGEGDEDYGITDIHLLKKADGLALLKRFYWDRWRGDEINNIVTAGLLVDWVWSSGKWGIVIPQTLLGCEPDGIVTEQTIKVLNDNDTIDFFEKLYLARMDFLNDLVNDDPTQLKYEEGWLSRLEDFIIID